MKSAAMEQILDALNDGRQRATYGAVAAVLDVSPRALMAGRERTQRHSFIVNVRTGMPTEYSDEAMHPDLVANELILKTKEALLIWLSARGVHVDVRRDVHANAHTELHTGAPAHVEHQELATA